MARSRDLKFNLVADVDSLRRGLRKAEKDIGKLEATTTKAGRGISAGFSGVARAAKFAGVAIGAGIVYEAKRAVVAFQESNKVSRQTQAVLKSTGGVANVTAKHVSDLASSISRKTGVDDEAIASGENLLLTFKNVRNEVGKGNKVFDRATQAAVNLSAAGFGDLSGTSKQLGKALNDPVKGITALGRAGVTFTQEQKDTIASLVEHNDLLGAQKIILREVESQVAGSAKAQATSTAKLRVAFGNLEEDLGSGLAPAVDAIADKLTEFAIDVEPQVIKAVNRIGKVFGRKDLSLEQKFRLSRGALEKNFEPLIEEARRSIAKMKLGDKLGKAVEDAAPMIADAMATAAPRAAGAFVRAFKEAGPWGKLITVAFLASKLGAFNAAGSWAGGKLIGGLKGKLRADKTLAATATVQGTAGGAAYSGAFNTAAAGGVAGSARGGKLRNAFAKAGKGLGNAFGIAAAVVAAAELEKALVSLIPKIEVDIPGIGKVGVQGAKPAGSLVPKPRNRVITPKGGVPKRKPSRDHADRLPIGKASLVGKRPKAGAASVLEVFHDPAGIPSPGRDHHDHVHVGADGGDLEYLMSVATGQFGLTITSTTRSPAQNVAANGSPTSLHLRGMAFDASGSQSAMIAFAKWVQSYRGGGSGGRALNVKATSRSASRAAAAHKAFNKSQRVGVRSQRAQLRRERRSWMPTRQDIFDTQMASGEALLAQGDPAGADIQAVTLRKRLKQIDRVLARKIKPKRRTRLTQERADILGQLGSLTETYGPQPPEPPEPGPTPGDFGESALALAGLTKTTADDVAALEKLKDIRQAELDLAKASGDPRVITEAANALGQVISSLESLTPTAKDFGSADLALARLTETTADDVAALEKLKGLAQSELDAAKASGDPFRIIEAAGAFGSLIEDLKALQASQPRTVTIDIHDAQFGNLAELNGFAERLAFRIATAGAG